MGWDGTENYINIYITEWMRNKNKIKYIDKWDGEQSFTSYIYH